MSEENITEGMKMVPKLLLLAVAVVALVVGAFVATPFIWNTAKTDYAVGICKNTIWYSNHVGYGNGIPYGWPGCTYATFRSDDKIWEAISPTAIICSESPFGDTPVQCLSLSLPWKNNSSSISCLRIDGYYDSQCLGTQNVETRTVNAHKLTD